MAIITIRRGTKSGGQILAECLADRLGYPILGREVVQQAAADMGVPPEDLGETMEDRPGLFAGISVRRRFYLAAVQVAVAEAAVDGNLVYHGLAGGLLLRGAPSVLRVHLIAPLEMRVRSLMTSHGMEEAEAENYIRDVDEVRSRWVKTMYGEDVTDPNLYDITLNLTSITIPEACEILVAAAERPEFEVTKERLEQFEDFRLGIRVRLALLEDLGTQSLDLDARARRGRVEVSGQAPLLNTGEVAKRIVEIARAVPGVEDVVLNIGWFDPYP